jgi:hypothetical protein
VFGGAAGYIYDDSEVFRRIGAYVADARANQETPA